MSQSVDFRINHFINEYLDYKGFHETVESFSKERQHRQEPIQALTNGDRHQESDQEQTRTIRVLLLFSSYRSIDYVNDMFLLGGNVETF